MCVGDMCAVEGRGSGGFREFGDDEACDQCDQSCAYKTVDCSAVEIHLEALVYERLKVGERPTYVVMVFSLSCKLSLAYRRAAGKSDMVEARECKEIIIL